MNEKWVINEKPIDSFLEATAFFSNNQFGFKKGINTEHALLNFTSGVHDGLNEGKCVSGLIHYKKISFNTVIIIVSY